MKNNTYLFIDGTNLYAAQYELFGPKNHLDFSRLIEYIERELETTFNKILFYASYSPKPRKSSQKQILYLTNEGFFYKSVRNTKHVVFFKGYRSPTSGKEKEVDVKLAVDIVDNAHRNMFDTCYIVSGDADFMHALEITRTLGKKVEIVAFENRIPHRFSFLYNTYVITLSENKKFKFHRKQKVTMLKVEKNALLKQI